MLRLNHPEESALLLPNQILFPLHDVPARRGRWKDGGEVRKPPQGGPMQTQSQT